MKPPKLFLFVAGILFALQMRAQELKTDTVKHEKGTTEVIVFSNDKGTANNIHSKRTGHDNNVVKIGVLYWVSGNIPVYYERRILPWLSVQGGLGLTTRDFTADAVNEIISEGGDNTTQFTNTTIYTHVYSDYADYSHRKAIVGVYASLQPKFYINNDALDGFYFSPVLEFKRYNYRAQMADPTQPSLVFLTNTYQNEYRNAVDFTVNIGWQWLFNPLMVEFNLSGGFRKFWESRFDLAQFNYSGDYVDGVRNYSGFRPEFNLALNFGGFF